MEENDLKDYRVMEYEKYVQAVENGENVGHRTMWDVAKYNPYAAYMFASRMEKGEIKGNAGAYYHRSAEYGCDRAFWKMVANIDYNHGVRDICDLYATVYGWHSSDPGFRDRSQRFRSEAVRRAETYPILWTAIAYGDLCSGDDKAFMDSSAKAIGLGNSYAGFLRGRRLLELANWCENDIRAREMADEAIGLLHRVSLSVWEASRLLGEEMWTGRWVPQDRSKAVGLISLTKAARPYRQCWWDYWREFLTSTPDPKHDGSSKYRMEGPLGRIGRRGCSGIAGTCEWAVLMRVTYTDSSGITSYRDRRGDLGGYENDVFRLIPWREEHPWLPFLEFKPAGVRLFNPEDPMVNADMDMDDVRMMLRICAESVEGASRWTRTVSRR